MLSLDKLFFLLFPNQSPQRTIKSSVNPMEEAEYYCSEGCDPATGFEITYINEYIGKLHNLHP